MVTVGEFIDVVEEFIIDGRSNALKKGVITQKEMISLEKQILRIDAARIFHNVLTEYLGEKDEEDWSSALVLRDLYDCHTCVYHIAQIYAKGIMESYDNNLFAGEKGITKSELCTFIERIKDKSKRVIPPKRKAGFGVCSIDQFYDMISNLNQYEVIDVRAKNKYLSNPIISNSVNIPLSVLKLNPYAVAENIATHIFVICEKGYTSLAAAELLTKAGFINVIQIVNTGEGE